MSDMEFDLDLGLDLDLTGVRSAGKPLPDGDYEFQIADSTVRQYSEEGSKFLVLRLEVISDEENGASHREQLSLSANAKPFLKAFLAALWGVEDDEIEQVRFNASKDEEGVITVHGINDRELVGATIGGTVKQKSTKDGTFANVIAWTAV